MSAINHMQKQIPDHIVNADKSQRRKTQRTLTKVVKRAGFSESSHLSCIEPENKVYVTNEKPSDYRRRHNHINVNSKHNMVVPWLGPASKSLIANIQSSRIYDTFRRSIKKTEDNDACKDSKSRVSMAIQDLNKSERVLNINSSLAASGPLLKTTIPNGYGKLTYPNGTVFIGEIENDLPNGHGKSLYFSGVVYEGDWKKGNREGKGKLTFSDGSYYEGAFLNKFHGQGVYSSREKCIVRQAHQFTLNFIQANMYLPV